MVLPQKVVKLSHTMTDIKVDEGITLEKYDYRIQAVSTLAQDFVSPWTKETHKKGDVVMAIAMVKFRKDKVLTFALPNITGMFLDFSYTLWEESELALNSDEKFQLSTSKHVPSNYMNAESEDYIFDALQKRMGSIVFAFSALESFANENIPSEYIYKKLRDDGRCVEEYQKDQIERYLNLDVKLGNILPPIMNVNSPKGKELWGKYKIIQNLRDRIIHSKSNDRKSSSPQDKTIWNELFSDNHTNCALLAKEIIGYFLTKIPKEKRPRWFNNFPYK